MCRLQGVAIAEAHLKLAPDDVRATYMGANGLVALGEVERGLEWARRGGGGAPSAHLRSRARSWSEYSMAGLVVACPRAFSDTLREGRLQNLLRSD
jgi:hypothetical protein